MNKLIATAFCAALTLPTFAMAAQTGANDVSPTGDGQEYMGSQATDTATDGKTTPSTIGDNTGNMDTGRQGHSAQMQHEGSDANPDHAAQQPVTNTGRQGASAEMEATPTYGNDDPTKTGESPSAQ
ncbi:hypothetical protein [Larsenimonas rhizosphaerae]|uniref:Uncharacterized protein n=1 Tax=Larsenimonas rhizosphaerae TaxID=2944682 RepID=A0AA41ZJ15_9GAMM|nr:hypothetical protein [Larsenimonas rhizosphaerae]MCM2131886.1 hypothetical protein [Larsenimonas rhizosphaerae]MCX2524808.1 hypothetical protein [Larsenimonas rhizosphaerae]